MEKILSSLSEQFPNLTGTKLTLLCDGAVQLYRVRKARSSVLAAIPKLPVLDGALAQLRYEYSIRSKLASEFSLRPERFIIHNQHLAMLLHDPRGRMVSEILGSAFSVDRFLGHAVSITKALAYAHASGIVHGALTPSSVMVHSGGLRAWLTGFRETQVPGYAPDVDSSVLHGAGQERMHYLAPEATGRIGRRVDARSDLYSLGCIFYQMLTGTLLFPNLTPYEEMHAHLTRQPMGETVWITGLSRVPLGIKSILGRLLVKEPEERYQSATDVVRDLLACESSGVGFFHVPSMVRSKFALAMLDTLVGRDREVEALHRSAINVAEGELSPLILLDGPAGIGKTALVLHLRRRLADNAYVFAIGKCEQADGATPYASLARALNSLSKGVLGYPPAEYAELQRRISEAVGDDAPLVAAVFPELKHLVGAHVYRRAVSAHAERPRFLAAMSKLLGAFAARGKPLVLFLDDLQWADDGTLEVLTRAVENPANPFVLFVGAMRGHEVEESKALARAIRGGQYGQRIQLGPLVKQDVTVLLKKLLVEGIRNPNDLSELIFDYTSGNPFFTIEFVRSLIDDCALTYDGSEREWHANISEVKRRTTDSSLIDLLAAKVESLSSEAMEVLRCLALLAKPTTSGTLAAAMQQPQGYVEYGLGEAVNAELLYFDEVRYSFTHDRVRDAVYYGMSFADREAAHLKVGRNLMESGRHRDSVAELFFIVNQLNMAHALVSLPQERYQYALENLDAARRSKEATAYASAVAYLENARLFAQGSTAGEEVDALIDLRWGECEFLSMDVTAALNRLNGVQDVLLEYQDRATLVRLRVALYVTLDDPEKALDVGLRYLAEETDVELPHSPRDTDIDDEYARFMMLYRERDLDDLVALPLMENENIRNAMDVLADLEPAALFTGQRMAQMVVLRMASLSLAYGLCDASCYAFVCLSIVVGVRYDDYRTVSRFGELAMRLPRERGITRFEGRVQMCYGTLNLPWTGAVSLARRHIEESMRLTSQQGDMTFGVYSRRNLATNLLFSGAMLSEAQRVVEDGIKHARQAGFSLVVDAFIAQAWCIREMRGTQIDIGVTDSNICYRDLLDDCLSGKVHREIAAFAFWTYELQVGYFLSDFRRALEAEKNAKLTMWAAPAFLESADFVFYDALLRVAVGRQSGKNQEEHLALAEQHLNTLAVWALASPETFGSREVLVRADLAHARGDVWRAQELYEKAISLADQSRELHLQGLSRELAARFSLSRNWNAAAQGYLKQAWGAYVVWGADAKLIQLADEFPELKLASQLASEGCNALVRDIKNPFDVDAVLKAARALSSEISLKNLVNILLDNALRYAAADRAVLCLLEDGVLNVVADATVSRGAIEANFEYRSISSEIVPTAIAYVTMRTRKSIVLDDARHDADYGIDPYVTAHQSRSVMCVPLLKLGMLTGLLYLENGLIAGAFTSSRLETLEVLASQAAISLENSKLYRSVEAEHERRSSAERHLRDIQGRLDRAARLAAMGELAAFIVHEVSQPISAVGTCSRAAARWLRRDDPNIEEALAMLDQIATDSTRATNIVESIRAMARKSPPMLGSVDINEAIREVLGVLGEQLRNGGVVVTGNFDDGGLVVLGDRILLQQVIMNLISNAIGAMSDAAAVRKQIDIRTCLDSAGVPWVIVEDTGPGIPDDMMPHIFDSLATTKQEGMGMGLSICRSIVEAHGGVIEAVPPEEAGACFRFSIPPGNDI